MMELIDAACLDSYFLSFYPSAIAAATLCIAVPLTRHIIHEATGFDLSQLQKGPVAILNHFLVLPFQDVKLPTKPVFGTKAFSEELYTRQTHHPQALEVIKEIKKLLPSERDQMRVRSSTPAKPNGVDLKSQSWNCPRCTKQQPEKEKDSGKLVLRCSSCNACRTHGEFDCRDITCKKSS